MMNKLLKANQVFSSARSKCYCHQMFGLHYPCFDPANLCLNGLE